MLSPVCICESQDWVAVSKPSGWLTHRSDWDRESKALLQWVREHQLGKHVYPVHRLDRGTSGVVLFAKSPEAAKRLMDQFETRSAQKCYLALVRGFLLNSMTIESPLRVIHNDESKGDYVDATTEVTVLARGLLHHQLGEFDSQRISFLKLMPKTGRTHQLRRHTAKITHPIIGDTKYGDRYVNRLWRSLGLTRLALHAFSLDTLETGLITSPLPDDIIEACRQITWQEGGLEEILKYSPDHSS
jgi:tRNA pseudouridine65 synthase